MSYKEMEMGLQTLRYNNKSCKNLNWGMYIWYNNILIILNRNHCAIQPDHQFEKKNCQYNLKVNRLWNVKRGGFKN